jgi:hypothetical protein
VNSNADGDVTPRRSDGRNLEEVRGTCIRLNISFLYRYVMICCPYLWDTVGQQQHAGDQELT